jgi:hypothetical protein
MSVACVGIVLGIVVPFLSLGKIDLVLMVSLVNVGADRSVSLLRPVDVVLLWLCIGRRNGCVVRMWRPHACVTAFQARADVAVLARQP